MSQEIIDKIEAKAESWRGQTYKLSNDAAPMHPYAVLRMLANELRAEQGLPLTEELRETEPGFWAFVKVAL